MADMNGITPVMDINGDSGWGGLGGFGGIIGLLAVLGMIGNGGLFGLGNNGDRFGYQPQYATQADLQNGFNFGVNSFHYNNEHAVVQYAVEQPS